LKFPVLKTDRLLLSELNLADVPFVYALFSDKQVVRYYDLEAFKDESQASALINLFKARFDNLEGIRWAIRLKNTEQCIGTCGVNAWNKPMRSATIGYDLHPQFWGKGIITEALSAMVDNIFSGILPDVSINRIQADTVPGNIASEKVLLKLGFNEEGLRRQSGYWKNQFHDLKCFGLLKDEFNVGNILLLKSDISP